MRTKFTLSRPATTINSVASWQDLGNGSASWSMIGLNAAVTLGISEVSNWFADDIANSYLGVYTFLVTASGGGGTGGNSAQITFSFLSADQNIIQSSDPLSIPNAGLSNYSFDFEATSERPAYVMIQVNNLADGENTVQVAIQYQPPDSSLEIAEPGGWQDHEIMLERHPDFCSLIESVFTQDKFVFIGNDNEDGDGGIDFIRTTENGGGADEKLEIIVEFAPDDVTYEDYFRGLLQLEDMLELPENEIEIPIIRDDPWTTLLKRWDTPVDVTSTVDLDGNAVDPLEPVTINMTSQVVTAKYRAKQKTAATALIENETTHPYIQFDIWDVELEEIDEKYSIPFAFATQRPENMSVTFAGEYDFDLKYCVTVMFADPDTSDRGLFNISGAWLFDMFLQVNDQTPVQFTQTNFGSNTSGSPTDNNRWTEYTLSTSISLNAGDIVRIYGKVPANGIDFVYPNAALVLLGNESGVLDWTGMSPGGGTDVNFSASDLASIDSHTYITADTSYPDTEVQGFWLHDLFDAVVRRISPYQGIYSETLGATFTKARQYDVDGCFSNFVCIKGVHLRGYTLTDDEDDPVQRYTLQQKPFFMSLRECWEGANPIFNLGLAYETLESSPDVQVIRIEDKAHFYDDSVTSVNFDHVYNIRRTYDKDFLFKKITIGYEKWESESYAGIDDPQTRHIYATRFKSVGKDITLNSGFVAASLAIETTRRMTVEKSRDYKYDNDTFIIAINVDDVSPEIYNPELDENFTAIANLQHSDTRYNLILTPLRNLLRWGNYLVGGLRSYRDSSIMFQSGEGNFDMQSTFDCNNAPVCEAIICDEIAESDDVPLMYLKIPEFTYQPRFDHLHLSLLYDITIPMEWEEYKAIRDSPKKPIGISQSDSEYHKFFVKQIRYNLMTGEATIQAWPKEYFEIQQIDNAAETQC